MDRFALPLAITTTLVLWASGFAAIGAALHGYSPIHIALLRFLLASVILAAVAVGRRVQRPQRADWLRISAVGLLGIALYNVSLNYGKQFVTAGTASFIVNTVPIFTTLLSVAFLGERLRGLGWLGMGLSFAGVSVLALGGKGLHLNPGALVLVGAAICQSLYFVLQKPLLQRYSPFELVCYAIWGGTGCMCVFLPGLVGEMGRASVSASLAVGYLGVFPSVAGYLCWSFVLARLPASRAATFLYLVPGLAMLIAYGWLREVPTAISLVGGALALAGVVVVNTLGRRSAPTAVMSSR